MNTPCASVSPSGENAFTAGQTRFFCTHFQDFRRMNAMTDYCENGKPKDCRYCYYYGRHGCMLKVCYYDRPKPETKPVSECDDCPYGKCGPCIGWCTKEILRSLERGRAK